MFLSTLLDLLSSRGGARVALDTLGHEVRLRAATELKDLVACPDFKVWGGGVGRVCGGGGIGLRWRWGTGQGERRGSGAVCCLPRLFRLGIP